MTSPTRRGARLAPGTVVFLTYRHSDEGHFPDVALAGNDGCPAVIADATACTEHPHCRVLAATPDGGDTYEYVHAGGDTAYAVGGG
jgi:hypothetical protein